MKLVSMILRAFLEKSIAKKGEMTTTSASRPKSAQYGRDKARELRHGTGVFFSTLY